MATCTKCVIHLSRPNCLGASAKLVKYTRGLGYQRAGALFRQVRVVRLRAELRLRGRCVAVFCWKGLLLI